MNAVDWIVSNCDLPLAVVELRTFSTTDGELAFVDPLHDIDADFFEAPMGVGRMVAFLGEYKRISKFALVYSEKPVAGGHHKGVSPVDAGMVSPVTRASFKTLRDLQNRYNDDPGAVYEAFFEAHHTTLENCMACSLLESVAMPIVDTGWGDGMYHSFALTDETGDTIAIYIDFMGRNKDEEWLMPPGVHLN